MTKKLLPLLAVLALCVATVSASETYTINGEEITIDEVTIIYAFASGEVFVDTYSQTISSIQMYLDATPGAAGDLAVDGVFDSVWVIPGFPFDTAVSTWATDYLNGKLQSYQDPGEPAGSSGINTDTPDPYWGFLAVLSDPQPWTTIAAGLDLASATGGLSYVTDLESEIDVEVIAINVPIPEPATMGLLSIGGLLLAARRRRR